MLILDSRSLAQRCDLPETIRFLPVNASYISSLSGEFAICLPVILKVRIYSVHTSAVICLLYSRLCDSYLVSKAITLTACLIRVRKLSGFCSAIVHSIGFRRKAVIQLAAVSDLCLGDKDDLPITFTASYATADLYSVDRASLKLSLETLGRIGAV